MKKSPGGMHHIYENDHSIIHIISPIIKSSGQGAQPGPRNRSEQIQSCAL